MTDLSPDQPRILLVDDQEEMQSPLIGTLDSHGYRAVALHPENVTVADVQESHLVLVDYHLQDWPERDTASFSRQPSTGIALLAVLRDHFRSANDHPIGFALNTARFRELPNSLPPPVTKHALARAHNFEWIFDKETPADVLAMCSLASACRDLPDNWEAYRSFDHLERLLGLPDTPWSDIARMDVMECRPPIHELSGSTDGLAFVRWLLHRILPYPCFLYDKHSLAVRLGLPTAELEPIITTNLAPDADVLEPVRYHGILSSFAGPRWWRAGVEALLWIQTRSKPFNRDAIRRFVQSISPHPLRSIPPRFGVLAINEHYDFFGFPVEISSAVRVQPDDWPPYADDSWTTRSAFEQSEVLQAIALPDDH